jgi:alpha-1,3-fucosyltransferase 10
VSDARLGRLLVLSFAALAFAPDGSIRLLFVNSMWGVYPEFDPAECSLPCQVSTDIEDLDDADVVVVHLPTARRIGELPRRPGQTWVAHSMESEVTVPALADERVMAQFDLEVSYRREADVWTPYVARADLEALLSAPSPKTADCQVAHFQSNPYDRSGRIAWFLALRRGVRIASYGKVFPNAAEAGTITTRDERLAVCSRHKFTLAFENSLVVDYVTDKLFDVWIAGSVPVYLGAPNVSEFAPSAHSYIDVADFEGPDELAGYLNHLDRHEDEYEAYLEWKRVGPDDRLLELLASVPDRVWCRVVELAHARRSATAGP